MSGLAASARSAVHIRNQRLFFVLCLSSAWLLGLCCGAAAGRLAAGSRAKRNAPQRKRTLSAQLGVLLGKPCRGRRGPDMPGATRLQYQMRSHLGAAGAGQQRRARRPDCRAANKGAHACRPRAVSVYVF